MNLKFLKIKKKFKKRETLIKPNLYWHYILFVTFLLMIAFCVLGFYLFIKTNNELDFPIIKSDGGEMIQKERVDKFLEYFSEREEKTIEILNAPSFVIDPSL